jgi:hypothetical protein
VENLLNHLPKDHKFWRSKLWGKLLETMKYYKVNDLDIFLKESVEKAKLPHAFTYQSNKTYLDAITEAEYKSIYGQTHRLNIAYKLRFVWCGNGFYDKVELREWCSRESGLSIASVNDKFNKINKKCYDNPTKIAFTSALYLDLKTMTLLNKDANTTLCYWEDYHNANADLKTDHFIQLHRDGISKKALDFMENANKLFGVKMAWGMGKSHYIMKPVIAKCVAKNHRILLLTLVGG